MDFWRELQDLRIKLLRNQRGGQVTVAGIRQQSYDNLAGVLRTLGQFNSSPQSSTGGNTYEQTLAVSELARGFKCILVCYTNNFVVNLGVGVHPDEAGADTLNLMRAALAGGQYRGGIRLNSYYLDIRGPDPFRVLAGAGYGAAGAYACNEDVNLVTGLLPDLGAGGCVVCSRVCRVYELTWG